MSVKQNTTMRELDARVAKEVMGLGKVEWANCHYDPECGGIEINITEDSLPSYQAGKQPVYAKHCMCDCFEDGEEEAIRIGNHTVFCYEIVPFYSVEMADAWQIVDKLIDEGWCVSLIYDDNGHWALADEGMQTVPDHWADDDKPDTLWTSFIIEKELWANTPAEAICRGALLALGEKDE